MNKNPEYVEDCFKIIEEFENKSISQNDLIARLAYEVYQLRNELKKIKGESNNA